MPRFVVLLLSVLLARALHADVVISEIMYHPASERAADEYVELHNTGAAAVNLAGWSLASGVAFTFPDVVLPAGGYLAVAADRAAFSARYPNVSNLVGGWTGRLSNSANTLVLLDNRGVSVDEVRYADDGDWAVRERAESDAGHRGWRWRSPADGFGRSLELIHAGFDNNVGQNWAASAVPDGTPGAANSVAAADIAPVVSGVRHLPLVPTSGQMVTVRATVRDDRGAVPLVTLAFRRDGETAWTVAPMFDDGAHDDGVAGDGVFAAQISPQPDGTIVEFHVSASDGARSRTWPAPAMNRSADAQPYVAEQSQNCLYQIDDRPHAGDQPLYRLVMKAADRATLAAINLGTGGGSHARFNATFLSFDGTSTEVRYLTGVRNRGHSSATRQPQSFNVAIPAASNWKGRTALNFNAQYTYLQLLGSAFMRRAGLVAAESRAIQLRVNNSDPTQGASGAPAFGLYVCNEVHDSEFAGHHFPTDSGGNLYGVRRTDDAPYEEGDFTALSPAGRNGGDPFRRTYGKETNVSEDDWTDLVALTRVLGKGRFTTLAAAPTWDADYATAVESRVDVGQWMTWFAAQTLVGNGETNLGNGYGDDFYVYFGVTDPRARLIPYDLDTVLGDGDDPVGPDEGLFPMIRHGSGNYDALTPTPLYPFFRHPAFAGRYLARLRELLAGPLSVVNVERLIDQTLTGLVDGNLRAQRKAWYAARHAHVSALLAGRLTVSAGPPVDSASGFPRSTTASVTLTGRADPTRTASVRVNGVAAAYEPWKVATTAAAGNRFTVTLGEWTLGGVALQPGVNRVLVQAFDAAGEEIDRLRHEVWYDDGSVAAVGGTIAANATWTAAGGPYRLNGPVTVGPGATLTIEAGTTVYISTGSDLVVAGGGRLIAEGTEARPIHFTRVPGSVASGGTIRIEGAAGVGESRLVHAFFNHGGDPAVSCEAGSNVVLERCEWLRNDIPYLELNGGSFVVSHCIFPSALPGTYFEAIHGLGAPPAGGRAIIRDSFFGRMNGYNDVIDFTGGNRPGTILQLYSNVFVGADDDIVDLDGTDAWIEGNLFMGVHRVGTPDSASAISGGSALGHTSEITIVGNLFIDVDQALTAKEGNFYTFLYNTVVDQNSRGSDELREDIAGRPDVFLPAVINLGDHGVPGARGVLVEGNVIHSAERFLRNYTGAERVTLNHNVLPPGLAWNGPGTGNVNGAALLAGIEHDPVRGVLNLPAPTRENFTRVLAELRRRLAPAAGSPAIASAPGGTNRGGGRPLGVSLAGVPATPTPATAATISVGPWLGGAELPAGPGFFPAGSGWTHYRWRLDGGPWSGETPVATPITLANLSAGDHSLEVSGRNDAGTYQDSPDLGASARATRASWRVDPALPMPAPPSVRINEVLASNTRTAGFDGVYPDAIELANVGAVPVDLGGWGLSDNASQPFKYTFPAGTMLAPGAYLVVHASSHPSVPTPRTGFGLGASGDDLTLTRSAAAGGGVADRIAWGPQLADLSIGRSAGGAWTLGRPTLGAANVAVPLAPASAVRINEWLADGSAQFGADFIELFNPGTAPVDLGGHFLTDNPVGWPDRSAIAPLTFIGSGGFLTFKADRDLAEGPDHVDFRLSPLQGEIGFAAPDGTLIDSVQYGPQRTDVAYGRVQGASLLVPLAPTPGAANVVSPGDRDGDGLPDAWEIAFGLDPADPADGGRDADGDGHGNLAEFRAGSNPRDPNDVPRVPATPVVNLSVLTTLAEGEVMTVGASIGGSGTTGGKALVVRAAGPSLASFGVSSVLPDPRLALFSQSNGASLASNNDWAGDSTLLRAFGQVGAFPYAAPTSKDAALAPPGLEGGGYSLQIADGGGGSGTVIAELYDATPGGDFTAATPRLINLSVLKRIDAGTTLTAGFVLGGDTPRDVLVRAVGPSLAQPPFNVSDALSDPRLVLYDNATGARLEANDDWGGAAPLTAAFAAVGAFPLAGGATRDAALLVRLAPGAYSVQISSGGPGGVALVEVYESP